MNKSIQVKSDLSSFWARLRNFNTIFGENVKNLLSKVYPYEIKVQNIHTFNEENVYRFPTYIILKILIDYIASTSDPNLLC